jgi:hypothetical protein
VDVKMEDDRRPRWNTPSSAPKKEWKSTISHMKRASSTVQVLTLPRLSPPNAEAKLCPTKTFKEAILKTDAAGACGLAHIRCGELAHAALGKFSPLILRMKEACAGESPQDADSLLGVMRDSLELKEIKWEIFKVANVGLKIAAGIFNQGIEEQRLLVCGSSAAKVVRSTLELCKPSIKHLFGGDESRIEKAVEAVKYRPYQAAPYRSKAPLHFQSSVSQEGRARKKTPYTKKPFKSRRSSGKANSPASKRGEGQKKK